MAELLLPPGVLHLVDVLSLGDEVGELLADDGGLLVPGLDLFFIGYLCFPTTFVTFCLVCGLD